MAAAFSVFKYGIIALAGWFVSMILLSIVWYMAFDMAISSDSATNWNDYPSSSHISYNHCLWSDDYLSRWEGFEDGRSDDVSFSYVDSWKTSIAGFVESIVVTAVLALMIGIGIGYELPALWILGALDTSSS